MKMVCGFICIGGISIPRAMMARDETQGFDVRSRYVEDEDVEYWILMSKLVSLSVRT